MPLKCLKQQLQPFPAGPDVSALNKTLQQEWDHAANLHLGNVVIKKGSGRKVWWKCNQCPDGHLHQWQATVDNRSRGKGCPQCSGKKLCKHNSLATRAPSVAAYWDTAKNGRSADMVLAHSNKPAHWRCCHCKHEWLAKPAQKVHSASGCPKCAKSSIGRCQVNHPSFAECQHRLLAEWDHNLNAAEGFFPDNVTLGSRKQVHWLCNKCPLGQRHFYIAKPSSRLSNKKPTGCPFCAGQAACKCNSLQTHFPSIAAEWDYGKNAGIPQDHTFGSNREVWWHNAERGSWQQRINSRTDNIRQLAAVRKYVNKQS